MSRSYATTSSPRSAAGVGIVRREKREMGRRWAAAAASAAWRTGRGGGETDPARSSAWWTRGEARSGLPRRLSRSDPSPVARVRAAREPQSGKRARALASSSNEDEKEKRKRQSWLKQPSVRRIAPVTLPIASFSKRAFIRIAKASSCPKIPSARRSSGPRTSDGSLPGQIVRGTSVRATSSPIGRTAAATDTRQSLVRSQRCRPSRASRRSRRRASRLSAPMGVSQSAGFRRVARRRRVSPRSPASASSRAPPRVRTRAVLSRRPRDARARSTPPRASRTAPLLPPAPR